MRQPPQGRYRSGVLAATAPHFVRHGSPCYVPLELCAFATLSHPKINA